jgi:ubiquinone/menaquinone biosynthesis C-methylase UbiE
MSHRFASFDAQAETYDRRAGLPEQACQAVARAALTMAGIRPGDGIVDIGAGSGSIGAWFPAPPLRYLGLDLSWGMLSVFRRRLSAPGGKQLLLQADAHDPWPLADASVRLIFSSRALHLLDLRHVVHESLRVARADGAVCIMGRVQRQDDSVSVIMQREMLRLLGQHGFQGHEGGQHQRQLFAAFTRQGAQELESVVVARWTVKRTAWQAIAAWDAKPGLAGIDPPVSTKQAVLDELYSWAAATFGGLHHEVASEEAYVLQGVRLRPRA